MSAGEKVLEDDIAHEPSSAPSQSSTPVAAGSGNMTGVPVSEEDRAHEGYVPSQAKQNPLLAGGIGAAIGAGTGALGKKAELVYNFLNKKSPGAVQNYANTQIAERTGRNLHIPLKDMADLASMPEVRNYTQAHQAINNILGTAAEPDVVQHVYARHPVTGQPAHVQSIVTPGKPGTPGIDTAKLLPYEKNIAHYAKSYGMPLLRSGVAGYDIGRGLDDYTSAGGMADIGAGLSALAAPLLKGKLKALANVAGALPVVGSLIPGANAAPMRPEQVAGTAVDLATGFMSPSELGEGTLRPRDEAYYPGMTGILKGTTLPPGHAEGGDVKKSPASIAGTLQEVGTVQGPSLASKWAEHLASLPQTTEENLRHQQDVISRAMPISMNNGKLEFGQADPEAMREMTDMVSGVGGMTKIVKDPIVNALSKVMRASEALAPHEGKWLNITQSDRMRSTGGDLGGPGFSKFQLEHPDYAQAQAAWGVGNQPTASRIINVNKKFPEGRSVWTPMIGSETQHQSNQHVYDALTNEFNRQVAAGKLTPELRQRINEKLALATNKEGRPLFAEGMDIANPEHLQDAGSTFERRGIVSNLLGGNTVGGQKGRIIDYPGIMQEMTDPMTVGAPTHSLGTRLFTLNNEIEHRPDLHSAFPYILKGEDQGVAFAPVPKELGIQDWINQFREFKGREPGFMDLTRNAPSQQITDKYLRSLQEAGHKEGGLVHLADGGGVAPYGFRHVESVDEVSLPKGTGWMGLLPNKNGQVSSELSASDDTGSFPMLTPNMNRQEIDSLLSNQQPTDEMYRKAQQFAKYRISQGKSPFISPIGELKWPLPKE